MANLFAGSFETGDTSQFTSAGGTAQASVVYGGAYAGANTDNTNFYKVLQHGHNPCYIHGMFRWSVDTSTSNNWFVLLGYGEANDQFYMQLANGVLKITINATNTAYTGHTVLLPNVWYSIEIYYYMDSSAGAIEVRINGVTEIAQSLINTKNGSDTGIMKAKWQGINAAGTCYVDDCQMDDAAWNYRKITMRVSLPGYNALTDGTIDHYSIFADSDNVLIKEQSRTLGTIASGGTVTLTHGSGYVPFYLTYINSGYYYDDRGSAITAWGMIGHQDVSSNYYAYAGTGDIKIINAGSAMKYNSYLFYDRNA